MRNTKCDSVHKLNLSKTDAIFHLYWRKYLAKTHITAQIKIQIFLVKNCNIFVLRHPYKGHPSYRRNLGPFKDNIQRIKTWDFFTFFLFIGLFCIPDPDPAPQNNWILIQSGEHGAIIYCTRSCMHAKTSESILSQWELLTGGISYLNQSEWHTARRPFSEASGKQNTERRGGQG